MLGDWEAIEIPEPRSRRQQLSDVLGVAALALRLLAHTPRLVWEVIREREGDLDTSEAQTGFVRPGSSEYGVIRLVKTSRGWVQFEFWGGPQITLGVYREDGWLPLSSLRHHLERRDLIEAMRAQGLPKDEAGEVVNLVLAERQARLAGDD